MRVESQILSNLLTNETYSRKVLPFLEKSYFQEKYEQAILSEVASFYQKYNKPITVDILKVQLSDRTDLTDTALSNAVNEIESYSKDVTELDWLIERTEKFCKQRAVYNAIAKSIKIIEGDDEKLNEEAIPSLLTEALAVCFDTAVGHSYTENIEERWEFYHKKEDKIPFDLKMLNKITQGGMARKALYCFGAPSGAGKSLMMTHIAASTIRLGLNVLYITMEMAEERIAERVDANLLKVDIAKLSEIDKEDFVRKLDKIKSKGMGRLFVKEYPTGSAHVGHFRALLEELKVKQNFKPDLIIVDYLGICASSRMKMGGSVNSYSYIKAVAEELRGLGVEYNVPIVTGAQLNRSGYDNSDVDMTSTADSMGIVHTLDVFLAMIRTEDLDAQNSVMIKQLKNRYADTANDKRFLLGLNRPKMTFYDLEDSAQGAIIPEARDKVNPRRERPEDDIPLFDKSKPKRDFGALNF
jgi:replicative DNA helicase